MYLFILYALNIYISPVEMYTVFIIWKLIWIWKLFTTEMIYSSVGEHLSVQLRDLKAEWMTRFSLGSRPCPMYRLL